jgi:PAS domain S-box-containing protein
LTHQTYTLLIVEDALIDRELYQRFLGKDPNCDYDLLEAESVEAGLEFCRTRSIDAILLDFQLPDGDGLEFLTALAAQCDGTMPPVVMLTGQGDEKIAVRAMKLGAQDYLVKRDLTPELLQYITERKQIEIPRIEAERERDRFFNLSIDLLAIGNFEGYFVRLNPAFEQILGFTNAELMAQPFTNFVHPDDLEHTIAGAQSLTQGDTKIDLRSTTRDRRHSVLENALVDSFAPTPGTTSTIDLTGR